MMTSGNKKTQCPDCKEWFYPGRGMSVHLKSCNPSLSIAYAERECTKRRRGMNDENNRRTSNQLAAFISTSLTKKHPHKLDLLSWKNLFLLVMFYFVRAIPRRAQTNLFGLRKIIFSALFNLFLASFV